MSPYTVLKRRILLAVFSKSSITNIAHMQGDFKYEVKHDASSCAVCFYPLSSEDGWQWMKKIY